MTYIRNDLNVNKLIRWCICFLLRYHNKKMFAAHLIHGKMRLNLLIHKFRKSFLSTFSIDPMQHMISLKGYLLNNLVICGFNVKMIDSKADIIARLKREILPLQGIRTASKNCALDAGIGAIKNAFPNKSFPLGAIHEFIVAGEPDGAATCGFIAGIISSLMQVNEALIWISSSRTVFPPALKSFGISPDKIIFIDLQKEREVLWVLEEALKCVGLSAVLCEMPELNFNASRRLQLAVEQSGVTGFIIRRNPRSVNITACVTRWQVSSVQSESANDLPGVGFPRWNVELLKVRNGTPGKWQIEFAAGQFRQLSKIAAIPFIQKKKTG